MKNTSLTANIIVNAPIERIWEYWTNPVHIAKWNNIGNDWQSIIKVNDVIPCGSFHFRMEKKDGSFGFDFDGTYDEIIPFEKISYTISDGRRVINLFNQIRNGIEISETFDIEKETPVEEQKVFCQSILNSFKKYTETNNT